MELKQNPYACAFCQENFINAITLVNHVKGSHESVNPPELKSENVINIIQIDN